ncbi:MAG TPA: cytochrome P450 [Sporichthya sp.]|nr:cytochrome P450 [Sporichthya sp.]
MDSATSLGTLHVAEAFDPLSSEYLMDPYPILARARAAGPVFYSPALDHWVVTRFHDIRTIFRTPALFSATNANAPLLPPCPRAVDALAAAGFGAVPTLANVDPPAHTRVRRMANSAFTPRRIAAMEPLVREVVVRFCEERLDHGSADLVQDFAWELPVLVLFSILGTPEEDVAAVKAGSWARILFVYGHTGDDEQVAAAEGMGAFWRYAERLIADRLQTDRGDFTSDLVRACDEHGEGLSPQQAATIALNLLFAGHETTTGLLGNAFRRLLGHRQAWDAICRDPSLIPGAIEEVLRFDSSVIAWRRQTTAAVDIGGVAVPAGAKLLLMIGSGNRDAAVFPDPDTFDIRRPNARDHLSFGNGPHFCLGAPLARLQARVVLEEISARLPSLRLEGSDELRFAPNVSFRGPLALRAVWDVTPGS